MKKTEEAFFTRYGSSYQMPSRNNIGILLILYASVFVACNSPKTRHVSDTISCDSAIHLLTQSKLFFSTVDTTSSVNSIVKALPNITVRSSIDTVIDFTSFDTYTLYLDTANILKYIMYDPTYATKTGLKKLKLEKRKQGEEKKREIAGGIKRFIVFENNTDSVINFISTEFLLVAILEVEDESGEWFPIQYFQPTPNIKRAFDFNVELRPRQKFVAVDTMKLNGSIPATVRYKFLTDKGFLYSKKFNAEINACLSHGISRNIMDSLSQMRIYFLDKFITR